MPFLAQEHFPIPTKDISSWTFDELSYDWDDPIYVDGNNPSNSISARQALSLTRKLVAGFRAIGAQRGDCVCINSFNDVQYPILFHGLVAGGLIFSGVNPAYTAYELAHTLKIAKVKYLLTQPDMLDNVLKATEEIGMPKENVIIFNPNGESAPSGFKQWNDLLQHGEQDWEHFDDLERARNTSVARLFSSGTTGMFPVNGFIPQAQDNADTRTFFIRSSQGDRSVALQPNCATHNGVRSRPRAELANVPSPQPADVPRRDTPNSLHVQSASRSKRNRVSSL